MEMLNFSDENSTYSFRTTVGRVSVSAKEIMYFSYSDRHVYLHTINGVFKTKIVRFKDLEDILKEPEFVSIHRACIVNICYIKSIGGITLIMENGEKLSISRYKMLEMKEKIKALDIVGAY